MNCAHPGVGSAEHVESTVVWYAGAFCSNVEMCRPGVAFAVTLHVLYESTASASL
jgi:hypothetical protein